MKTILFLICVLLIGCHKHQEEVTSPTNKSPKTIFQRLGLAPSKEEVALQHELKVQQLKDGDALVAKWADQIQETATKNFGFEQIEGLTEFDPWGQNIKITYHQEWFNELATIQSAGPDGLFNTDDDLIRIRTAKNPSGIFEGMSTIGWVVLVWLVCGMLALLFSSGVSHRRVAKGKSKKYRHPIVHAVSTVLFGPFTVLIYGLQFIGGAVGAHGEFFDGFDLMFEGIEGLDIDIDI